MFNRKHDAPNSADRNPTMVVGFKSDAKTLRGRRQKTTGALAALLAVALSGCVDINHAADLKVYKDETADVSVTYTVEAKELYRQIYRGGRRILDTGPLAEALGVPGLLKNVAPLYEDFVWDALFASIGDPYLFCSQVLGASAWLDALPEYEKYVAGDRVGVRCFAERVSLPQLTIEAWDKKLNITQEGGTTRLTGSFNREAAVEATSELTDNATAQALEKENDRDEPQILNVEQMFEKIAGAVSLGAEKITRPSYRLTVSVTAPGKLVNFNEGGVATGDAVSWTFDSGSGEMEATWERRNTGVKALLIGTAALLVFLWYERRRRKALASRTTETAPKDTPGGEASSRAGSSYDGTQQETGGAEKGAAGR